MKSLLERYQEDERIAELADQLKSESPKRILIQGFVGALESFVLSGIYNRNPSNHIYIANDKEEAAYVQNNLASLFENKTIHFFSRFFQKTFKI